MQEHIAKKLRISILLWLLLLALAFPYLIYYYEQYTAFQWEEMVQPHWETVSEPPPANLQDTVIVQDIVEPVSVEPDNSLESVLEQVPEVSVTEKPAVSDESSKKKIIQKVAGRKKANKLALKLPDNLYQGEAAEWDEKKPVAVPDLFAPKKGSRSFQVGGRLIVDDDTMRKEKDKAAVDASYLDAVKGAEVNISIKVP